MDQVKADGGGLRYDEGKSRVDLLPGDALIELGKLYGYGCKKYSERNWERGMPWSKALGPLLRHLFKWMMGAKADEESGLSHMVHVAWNALALVTYELRKIGADDVHGYDNPVPEAAPRAGFTPPVQKETTWLICAYCSISFESSHSHKCDGRRVS